MRNHFNFSARLERFKLFLLKKKINPRLVFIIIGIVSTIWFLIRVLPKPSRATYPCMRVAAPVMSGFVIYILSLSGAVLAFRGAKKKLHQAKYIAAASLFVVSIISAVIYFIHDTRPTFAATTYPGPIDGPNAPMGKAYGLKPGRVAWAWNPNAVNQSQTDTKGVHSNPGNTGCGTVNNSIDDFYFLPKNNNQSLINQMISAAIMSVADDSIEADAWNDLFVDFNTRKGRSTSGYQPGQIIFIKINGGGFDCPSYYNGDTAIGADTTPGKGCYCDYLADLQRMTTLATNVMNTTPFSVFAMIKSLVEEAGVPQNDIYIGDPMKNIYTDEYNYWKASYPNINVLGNDSLYTIDDVTGLGRVRVHASAVPLQFYSDSGRQMTSAINDKLYTILQQANYIIDLASFKAHARAGITLCAKNFHGCNTRSGAGHLHQGLLCTVNNDQEDQPGYSTYYRVQVDDLSNKYLGGNTMLFLVDALYDGEEGWEDVAPVKWTMSPFNNTFPSSIFMSQDPVAIESVCYDFLRTEFHNAGTYGVDRPNMNGTDDYLRQAADPTKWPKTVGRKPFVGYGPNGDGKIIGSLGVFEHWNDTTHKQYSRNLDPTTGTGIELVFLSKPSVSYPTPLNSIKTNMTDFSIYPLPVHATATVSYSLSGNANVEINIININGIKITSLVNQTQQAGEYQALFDASAIESGIYYCEFVVNGKNVCSKQIQIIK